MKVIFTSANFTRPNDAAVYAAGDLIANSTTAGSVVPLQWTIGYGFALKLFRTKIKFNSAVPTLAQFKLHFYGSSPTVTNGDNGAWLSTESNYQHSVSIDASTLTFSDSTSGYGIYVNTALSMPMYIQCDQNYKIYGLLTATAAYTPTALEVFTVDLYGETYT
jgi:hypothetical protein